MFHSMSIVRRLSLLAAVILALTAAAVVVNILGMDRLQDMQSRTSMMVQATRDLSEAQNAMWQLRFGVSQYLAVPKPEERRRIIDDSPKWFAALDQALEHYSHKGLTPQQMTSLAEMSSVYGSYKEARPHWFDLMEAGKVDEAAEWRGKTILVSGAGSVKALSALIDLQDKASHEADIEADRTASLISSGNILGSIVATAIMMICLFLFSRSLSGPLREMVGPPCQ